MLHLDELIEQHAYDELVSIRSVSINLLDLPSSSLSSGFNSTLSYSSPPIYPTNKSSSPPTDAEPIVPDFRVSNLLVPSLHGPISLTKPIPPPASLPRKLDPTTINQRVIHPPKESCFKFVPSCLLSRLNIYSLISLPIIFPSIPEGGTKSRVETQVRVTVDLADSSSPSDPFKYDRVGSWKWLKLPHGTATKKRTRKQGKIGAFSFLQLSNNFLFCSDPDPNDVLHLTASVTCSSPPHNRVLSCSSCQTREVRVDPLLTPNYAHFRIRRNVLRRSWLLECDRLVLNLNPMLIWPANKTGAKTTKIRPASFSSIAPKSLISQPGPSSCRSASPVTVDIIERKSDSMSTLP